MTSTNGSMPASQTDALPQQEAQPSKPQKLRGREFYESIGSPKLVLAPMVDQSEFVRRSSRGILNLV
jgi:tRNA-dihydrouridine synthase 1